MGTDLQSGSPSGTDWQRDSDGHTDWQRKRETPAQRAATIVSRQKEKFLTAAMAVDRANRKKRGKGRLGAAPNRTAINRSIATALPTSAPASGGQGIASPLTEISRETTLVRICDPSDATTWIDIEAATKITFNDANGLVVDMILTPDTTGNCP